LPSASGAGKDLDERWQKVVYRAVIEAAQRGRTMINLKIVMIIVAAGILGGCENMSSGQKGAVAGGALGTGIGMVAGGSFGQVVGAGLIGGAVGYVGGSAVGNR
jgi:hypothetical protein